MRWTDFITLSDVVVRIKDKDSVLLMGDFNARIGNRTQGYEKVMGKFGEDMEANRNGKQLLDFCASMGLVITNSFFKHKNIHRYTWEARGTRSIIDYVITDQELRKAVRDTRVFRGFFDDTDHYLICSEIAIVRPKVQEVRSICRRIRVEKLQDKEIRHKYIITISERYQLVECSEVQSLEKEWTRYRDTVLEVARECLGTVVCKSRKKQTAWWNDTVKAACKRKKKAYQKWLSTGTQADRESYVVERNKAKQIIAASKQKSWEDFGNRLETLGQAAGKPFWSVISSLRKGGKKEMTSVLDRSGKLLVNPVDALGRWREYFEELLNVGENTFSNVSNFDVQWDSNDDGNGITLEEVKRMVNRLQCNKAAGVDEIKSELIKYSGLSGLKWLHRIINMAWESGQVPSDWTKAVITPIFKNGNRKDCNNYRGISLISVVGKIFSGIVERRVRVLVEDKLDENQCGFRPLRGCQDQIFSLRQIMEKSYEWNRELYLCFIDLEKAYDRVPRGKLLSVLRDYGIGGKLLQAIKGLYLDSQAAVRVDGKLSSWFRVVSGVRQGCNLSPLLFILFMDHMLKTINWQGEIKIGENKISSLAYADDLVVMADSIERLQNNISELDQRCKDYGMKISISKTKVMSVGKRFKRIDCQIGGTKLEQVDSFKYLGCIFSQDANIVKELEARCSKANAVSAQLRSTLFCKKEVSTKTKLSVHRSIFRPTLLYGSESWVDTGYLINKVEVTDMKVARMIAGTNRWEQWQEGVHNEEIKEKLGMNTIDGAVRANRLRWWGHVTRMGEARLPKRLMGSAVEGRRSRGRPRRRYLDSVRNDFEVIGLTSEAASKLALNRGPWRSYIRGTMLQTER